MLTFYYFFTFFFLLSFFEKNIKLNLSKPQDSKIIIDKLNYNIGVKYFRTIPLSSYQTTS